MTKEKTLDSPVTDTPATASRRARFLLILYVIALLLLAVFLPRNSAADMPLWNLQDTRQLVAWLKCLFFASLIDFAKFIPIGLITAWALAGGPTWRHRLLRFGGSLVVAAALAVAIQILKTGSPAQSLSPIDLFFPAAGFLLGRWIGARWRQGSSARRWLVPQLALLGLLIVAAAVSIFHFAIQDRPLPFAPAAVTSVDKRHLVRLLRSKDPTAIRPGRYITLDLTKNDIDRLLAWGLSVGSADRKAQVHLNDGNATLYASVRLNRNSRRPRYLNLAVAADLQVEAGHPRLRINQLTVGNVTLPRLALRAISPAVVAQLHASPATAPFLDTVQSLAVLPGHLQVTYTKIHLPKDFRSRVFGALDSHDELRSAVQIQVNHLLDQAPLLDTRPEKFGACLEAAFALARQHSMTEDPIQENRAAILALGMLLGHWRVQDFTGPVIPKSADSATARLARRTTLRGRHDWVRHFALSAAIEVLSTQSVTIEAGLLKEQLDAGRGGTGFSFGDLLADRAGTAFALTATQDEGSARAVQDRLAQGFHVDDFFPAANGLPEGVYDEEMKSRFGGVGGPGYNRLITEIEHRVDSCPAYR